MRHVAALAGVGIKTVSRVINDEPGYLRGHPAKGARRFPQLNYQLDMAAGSLRRAGRRTLSIGLLLPSVSNPSAVRFTAPWRTRWAPEE
jgi:LacI family transcriptional regulator